MDWQPIESAPKDGTRFIAAKFNETRGEWQCDDVDGRFVNKVPRYTHWQPLPPPPNSPGIAGRVEGE